MTKDSLAPSVTIVSAVPSTLGPSDPSTNITWHASENGTYSVRVGGSNCSTGTQVATGSYTTSPANVVTNMLASQLAEGANTIRVCVTDAATNTGSATTTVTKNTAAPGLITFRSASSAANGPANSLVLPVPAGVATNDVLIAFVDVNTAPAITPPAGWTLIRSDTALGSGNAIIQSAYYHVAGASEPASYTWTLASSHAASGGMLAYSGVSTSNPIDRPAGRPPTPRPT